MAKQNIIETYRDGLLLRVRFNGEDLQNVIAVEERSMSGASTIVRLEMVGEIQYPSYLPDPAQEDLPF